MRHNAICGLNDATGVVPHYPIKGTILKKNVFEHKMGVLIFPTVSSVTFLILWRIQWHMAKNVYRSSCKVLVIPVRFQWNLNSLEINRNKSGHGDVRSNGKFYGFFCTWNLLKRLYRTQCHLLLRLIYAMERPIEWGKFYVLLNVLPGTTLGKWPTWCTVKLYNTFLILLLLL